MSNVKRKEMAKLGRVTEGKTAVAGAKDRATKKVNARVVSDTTKGTLQGFVVENAAPTAKVYTDDASAYEEMDFDHHTVVHSAHEYVKGDVNTNAWRASGAC